MFKMQTRNAMRCNNRDDLLHLGYALKISIYFIAKIVSRLVYSQKSCVVDARLDSKYAPAF